MTTQSTNPNPATTYTPPLELLQAADRVTAEAAPEEMAFAARLYEAYGVPTAGRSAITGTELPAFDISRPLLRAGWLSVARAARRETLTVTMDPGVADERVDPFLMGISEIAGATRDLAEAAAELARARALDADTSALEDLIKTTAEQLHTRVKILAAPPTEI